jgi:hypothetical protein
MSTSYKIFDNIKQNLGYNSLTPTNEDIRALGSGVGAFFGVSNPLKINQVNGNSNGNAMDTENVCSDGLSNGRSRQDFSFANGTGNVEVPLPTNGNLDIPVPQISQGVILDDPGKYENVNMTMNEMGLNHAQLLEYEFVHRLVDNLEDYINMTRANWTNTKNFVTYLVELNYEKLKMLNARVADFGNQNLKIRFLQPAGNFYNR